MSSFSKYYCHILLMAIAFFACDTKQNIDREAIKKEIKSREIIRLTDTQVQMEAERVGGLVTADSAVRRSELMTTYQIITDTVRWQDDISDSTFLAIREVYQYAGESGIDPPKGIQADGDKVFYYCVPITDSTGVAGVVILTMPKKELVLNYTED
ncbi:MAG: hypothetical protein WBA74_04750 [Cyclobacteriaceae bacterium]